MFLIEEFLTPIHILELINLIDSEIENGLCLGAPLYQSYSYMHTKYSNDQSLQNLLNKTTLEATKFLGKTVNIKECWFNICKEDSAFGYHTHSSKITAVFFLKGCNGNGTLFKINNATLQLKANDNSLLLFEPSILHTIPDWDGEDRYSIAIDFEV
jgi:hypothetical protein